jgi:hypothetical protein
MSKRHNKYGEPIVQCVPIPAKVTGEYANIGTFDKEGNRVKRTRLIGSEMTVYVKPGPNN